jgi:peptidase M1-like protein
VSRRRAAFAPFILALCLSAGGAAPVAAAPAGTAVELLDRLEKAWLDRDTAAYLDLWWFPSAAARDDERNFASERFAAEASPLELQRPPQMPADSATPGASVKVSAQLFTVTEPRARVEQWLFVLERASAGWQLVAREGVGFIDGLVHLSLDPAGYRADGLTLRFDDFTLEMHRGTLFTSPVTMGPTALAFVGEATVHIRPWPETEREQLRQFAGKPELVDRVKTAFVRIHPADLYRVLTPARLEPDPPGASRFPAAQRFYREQSMRSFVLDSSLPRSPWWLLPGLGDSSATFQTRRHGTLTFTVSTSEPEAISLFDRDRKRQICLYPQKGREARYSEDDSRSVDVVHHDLKVRFDPRTYVLEAEDTIRLRLLEPNATVRLRLEEDLHIHSITSAEAGLHLFFRVRHQDSVMVSLGALAGRTGELSLTVRYGGALYPGPVEREMVQAPGPPPVSQIAPPALPDDVLIEEVLVYSNRSSWYPQGGPDDYAMADLVLDVPQGYNAVAGGTRLAMRTEGGRTQVSYRQDRPGKYITVAIGRLAEIAVRAQASVPLKCYTVGRTRSDAAAYAEKAAEILRFYEEEFGAYPYGSLTVVVVEGHTPGGHSPPGMVIMAQRPILLRHALRDDPANFTDVPFFFLAHELAHQWWGQGIAGENYHERWLSEGVAQYAAVLWTRHSQGEETFRDVMERMGRWALRMTDKGPIYLGHRLGHLKDDPQIFRAVVYDKGAYVLHMIRSIVGERAFREALKSFQTAYRFRKAGTDDLRQALETASGRDLRTYFETWIRGTTLPRLQVSSRTRPIGAGHLTVVEVKAEGLPGPVPLRVALQLENGKELREVSLAPEGGSWSFETGGPVQRVRVNDDRGLLARMGR